MKRSTLNVFGKMKTDTITKHLFAIMCPDEPNIGLRNRRLEMTYKKFYCDPGSPSQLLKIHKTEMCECTEPHEDEWYELNEATGIYVKLVDLGWWV